ncbi:MAG: hypothetical protein V4710_15260 [Verrucomicrobiota bacterium]
MATEQQTYDSQRAKLEEMAAGYGQQIESEAAGIFAFGEKGGSKTLDITLLPDRKDAASSQTRCCAEH